MRRRHLAGASLIAEVVPKSSSIVAVARFSRDFSIIAQSIPRYCCSVKQTWVSVCTFIIAASASIAAECVPGIRVPRSVITSNATVPRRTDGSLTGPGQRWPYAIYNKRFVRRSSTARPPPTVLFRARDQRRPRPICERGNFRVRVSLLRSFSLVSRIFIAKSRTRMVRRHVESRTYTRAVRHRTRIDFPRWYDRRPTRRSSYNSTLLVATTSRATVRHRVTFRGTFGTACFKALSNARYQRYLIRAFLRIDNAEAPLTDDCCAISCHRSLSLFSPSSIEDGRTQDVRFRDRSSVPFHPRINLRGTMCFHLREGCCELSFKLDATSPPPAHSRNDEQGSSEYRVDFSKRLYNLEEATVIAHSRIPILARVVDTLVITVGSTFLPCLTLLFPSQWVIAARWYMRKLHEG